MQAGPSACAEIVAYLSGSVDTLQKLRELFMEFGGDRYEKVLFDPLVQEALVESTGVSAGVLPEFKRFELSDDTRGVVAGLVREYLSTAASQVEPESAALRTPLTISNVLILWAFHDLPEQLPFFRAKFGPALFESMYRQTLPEITDAQEIPFSPLDDEFEDMEETLPGGDAEGETQPLEDNEDDGDANGGDVVEQVHEESEASRMRRVRDAMAYAGASGSIEQLQYQMIVNANVLTLYVSLKQLWLRARDVVEPFPKVTAVNEGGRNVTLSHDGLSPPTLVVPRWFVQREISRWLYDVRRVSAGGDVTHFACYSPEVRVLPEVVWQRCKHHFWNDCFFSVPEGVVPETITLYMSAPFTRNHHYDAWQAALEHALLSQMAASGRFKVVFRRGSEISPDVSFVDLTKNYGAFGFYVHTVT